MTANQIAYQKNLETERNNRVSEELGRNTLAETQRSNVARETETHRANLEAERNRDNVLAESIRHNKTTEEITRSYNAQSLSLAERQLGESMRHNQASEQLQQSSINAGIVSANIAASASKYATDVRADTATADRNYQALTAAQNRISNERIATGNQRNQKSIAHANNLTSIINTGISGVSRVVGNVVPRLS